MADKKISALVDGGVGVSTDYFVVQRGSADYKLLASNISTRQQIAARAAGVISETESPGTLGTVSSPASGSIYGRLLGFCAGDIVTGLMLRVSVAAAGTAPTTVRAGIADSTGKTLALSGNLAASAFAATGAALLALSSPYTIPSDGGYFLEFIVNGTWGTTQPTLLNGGVQTATDGARPGYAPPAFTLPGQTDLPAVNSTVSLSVASVRGFYLAAYN